MTELQQKQLAFLEDTVKYYSEDTSRRATVRQRCRYITDDGRKCAIGRHLPDNLCKDLQEIADTESGSVSNRNIFEKLPEDLKYLGVAFLEEMQGLHDRESEWGSQGLSKEGENTLMGIKRVYNLNQ